MKRTQSKLAAAVLYLTSFGCLFPWSTVSAFLPGSLSSSRRRSSTTPLGMAAVVPGDGVLVIGGTGGVGQLVTQKLKNSDFDVRVTSRNVEGAKETLGADVDIVPLDLINGSSAQLTAALEGISGVVISVGTTAFPTMKWRGGNTPKAIDEEAVTKIVKAATVVPTMKKIVLITSVGVYRTDEMPFKVLNLFGVLDAKRAGEDALKQSAKASENVDYVIVRPGRLIGGPFTNLDVARLLQIEGGADNGVDVAVGDDLLGDCKRDACAEAIVQALRQEAAKNVEFSLCSNDKAALKDEEWKQVFSSMKK